MVADALDYGGLSATMGKNTRDDFKEGKVTLPVVIARDAGNEAERGFWRRAMGGDRSDDDFHRALALLRRYNAIGLTLDSARQHAGAAKQALLALPANAYADALTDLADFVIERGY